MVRAMKKKMKIIEIFNKIANGEEVPKKIMFVGNEYRYDNIDNTYRNIIGNTNIGEMHNLEFYLNDEVEILDDEEDKDIPLIPDDELIILKQSKTVDMQYAIDFNFKVLKEKINQVVEEFNEYRKENEENEKQKEKK